MKNSHFYVGSDKNNFTTEASNQYCSKKVESSKLNMQRLNDLRHNHFNFGNYKNN